MRKLASTWVAKILFFLLVLSFAVWGIDDMVKTMFAPDTALATVAGEKIPLEEGQTQLKRELQRLTRQLGDRFEPDARIRRALAEQAVDQLVLDRSLRAEQKRLGVAVPDDVLRDFVFGIPAFRGADGRFSRPIFDNFLRQNELTEQGLLGIVRNDLGRQQVTLAVAAGAAPPLTLTRPLLAWLQEQRSLAVVALPLAAAPEPEPATEAQLERFHANTPERFSTPETRAGTVAVMNAAMLVREVEVSEADLAAGYEARRAQFDRPDKRHVTQVLVADAAKAKEIATAWAGGADIAAIEEQARGAGGQAIDLGVIERAILPLPELADAVFAVADGAVTPPVQSPFGWHVFKVDGIEPGRTSTLDEVRDQLRLEIASERAADIAFDRANKVEDALAGGAPLAEVAQKFGLGLAEFRMDAEGHNAAHQEVPLPVIPEAREPLLKAIFAAERGAAPRLQETEAGFVAIELKEVLPPALRPFAEVKAEVELAWAEDARRRAQEARAAKLLAETNSGTPILAAAAELGLGVREVGGVTRAQGEAAAIPRELIGPVFALKPKQATMVQTADGFAVAQLLDITPGDTGDAAALAKLKGEVAQSMIRDLELQYAAALRSRSGVQLNPRMLDALAQP